MKFILVGIFNIYNRQYDYPLVSVYIYIYIYVCVCVCVCVCVVGGTNVNEWKDNINNSATKIKKFISLLGAEV